MKPLNQINLIVTELIRWMYSNLNSHKLIGQRKGGVQQIETQWYNIDNCVSFKTYKINTHFPKYVFYQLMITTNNM